MLLPSTLESLHDEASLDQDSSEPSSLFKLENDIVSLGSLEGDDTDYFEFQTYAGASYAIYVTSDADNHGWNSQLNSSSLEVKITDELGNVILDSSPGEDENSWQFSFSANVTKDLYVQISDPSLADNTTVDYGLTMFRSSVEIDDIEPSLNSLSFVDTIDTSSGTGSIQFVAEASDDTGIERVTLYLDQALWVSLPGGDAVQGDIISINGDDWKDNTPGQASLELDIHSTSLPGTYQITKVEIEDQLGNIKEYDSTELEALGGTSSFNVVTEISPPTILSFNVDSVIDLSDGDSSIEFSLQALDASGIEKATIYLDQSLLLSLPGGTPVEANAVTISRNSWNDDTPDSGALALDIYSDSAPGTYNVTSILIEDTQGNTQVYSSSELNSQGINTQINVVTETVAPTLTSLSLTSEVDLSNGNQQIDFLAGAEDDSGISTMLIYLEEAVIGSLPGGEPLEASIIQINTNDWSDDTPNQGDFSLELYTTTAAGSYNISRVLLTDTQGNQQEYSTADLDGLGYSSSFNVINNNELVYNPDAVYTSVITGDYLLDSDDNYWDSRVVNYDSGTEIEALASQLYRAYYGGMGRLPDQGGFDWWYDELQNGRSLTGLAEGFIHSDEFALLADSNQDQEISNSEFVTHMYQNVFGRAADQEGYDWWMSELDSGARDQGQAFVDFTQSNEYVIDTLTVVADYLFS